MLRVLWLTMDLVYVCGGGSLFRHRFGSLTDARSMCTLPLAQLHSVGRATPLHRKQTWARKDSGGAMYWHPVVLKSEMYR